MERREKFNQLLISYLSNETTVDEEAEIVAWIQASEENKRYFKEFRNAWRLITVAKSTGRVSVDDEWNRFNEVITSRQKTRDSVSNGDYTISKVYELRTAKRLTLAKILIPIAVAATLVTLLVINWNKLDVGEKKGNDNVVKETHARPLVITPVIHHEKNISGKEKQVALEDGSIIRLSPASEVSYAVPFKDNRRDIQLIGKANFEVAKDKARPFTVYTEEISTTALGTKFTVSSYSHSKSIYVTLYEGKVVVKSNETAGIKMKDDYFLTPGQQLVYNRSRNAATLKDFRKANATQPVTAFAATTNGSNRDHPAFPEGRKGSWYMFNNQPLAQVFDQLQMLYKAKIEFSRKEVAKIYFIGSFEKTDPIEKILSKIALTNNLSMVIKDSTFIISSIK